MRAGVVGVAGVGGVGAAACLRGVGCSSALSMCCSVDGLSMRAGMTVAGMRLMEALR